jgi:pimeloyl-ACP methyl ester carboxylesterase
MPAVFVHGVADTHRLWNPLRSHLSRSDVIAVSLPGFDAPVPDGFDATKEAYAGWLIEELERIGEPVDLVGHDWGAMLVQRAVSLRPDLIRTWACGSGPVDAEYTWHEFAQQWQTPEVGEQAMAAMTPEVLAQILVENRVPREAAEEAAPFIDATMKDCILRLYRSAVHVGAEWQAGVETVTRPALILWGADDPYIATRFAERLAERVGGELLVFEQCGHWWPLERPAEAAAALERFWSSH